MLLQTADKGTEHEKDKKHHYKEENRVTNFHPIFCISLCFFVRNEPRLTVLSTVLASVRPVCTLSQQSISLMTRFVIKLRAVTFSYVTALLYSSAIAGPKQKLFSYYHPTQLL